MDIEQKLCILHLLDLNKKALSRDTTHQMLTSLGLFKPLEVELTLSDLVKNGLVKENNSMLSLGEEGLVVLHFFRDRLSLSLQQSLSDVLDKKHPDTQWVVDYDKINQRLYLKYEKQGEILLSLDFFLEPEAYNLIENNLSNLDEQDFTDLKMLFLNK